MDCPLCDRQVFPGARSGDAGKLSLALYDRILDEVGDYLYQCQIFGQGEPLMNWKLTGEIVARTHARGIFTMISTNATLITPDMAEALVASDLDHLVCAIDGIGQTAYETYRVGGKVADALAGLRHLVAARARAGGGGPAIEWQYLTHARNLHEVATARRMAADLGVAFRVAPLRGMEWDAALEDEWLAAGDRRMGRGHYVNPFPCYFLWRSLVLNSNAKVARCLVYQNASQYADLATMSVMEAYNHPSVRAARRLFGRRAMTEAAPLPCDGCGYFERHHGARPASRNDRLRGPAPRAGAARPVPVEAESAAAPGHDRGAATERSW